MLASISPSPHINFGRQILNNATAWNVLPHPDFYPEYTTFVRALSPGFVVGSTYVLYHTPQDMAVQCALFDELDTVRLREIIKGF